MSDRFAAISKLLKSRASRESYIRSKLNVLIPAQLRALRLNSETPKQADIAKEVDMKQSRISAMETPGAVNFNLDTLVRMAAGFKVGLVVKFVPISEMLRWENSFSQDTFRPNPIEQDVPFLHPELATWPALLGGNIAVGAEKMGAATRLIPLDDLLPELLREMPPTGKPPVSVQQLQSSEMQSVGGM